MKLNNYLPSKDELKQIADPIYKIRIEKEKIEEEKWLEDCLKRLSEEMIRRAKKGYYSLSYSFHDPKYLALILEEIRKAGYKVRNSFSEVFIDWE